MGKKKSPLAGKKLKGNMPKDKRKSVKGYSPMSKRK